MEEQDLSLQISELSKKIDFLIEEVAIQKAKRQEMEDLLEDMKIIGKDVFDTAVLELDKAGIEPDRECVARLGLNIMRNVSNFNDMLATLQSFNDFFKDFTPILRQMGLDTIHKLAEFEQKGYFEYIRSLGNTAETIMRNFSPNDINNLNKNIPVIIDIFKNIVTDDNLIALKNITETVATINMDDEIDNKSLYKIYKELKSPEVRKTISFMLRMIKEIVKNNEIKKNISN